MSIARVYRLTGAPNQGQALLNALQRIVAIGKNLPGSEGMELLRDTEHADNYLLIEKWASVQAHKSGMASFPADALAPLMAALASPPDGGYFDYPISRDS